MIFEALTGLATIVCVDVTQMIGRGARSGQSSSVHFSEFVGPSRRVGTRVVPTAEVCRLAAAHSGGRTLAFSVPVDVEIEEGELGWEARIPEFDVVEFGESREQALAAAHDVLLFLWDEYALERDDRLDVGAQRLAARLRQTATVSDDATAGA
jgi:hypothetical protein